MTSFQENGPVVIEGPRGETKLSVLFRQKAAILKMQEDGVSVNSLLERVNEKIRLASQVDELG